MTRTTKRQRVRKRRLVCLAALLVLLQQQGSAGRGYGAPGFARAQHHRAAPQPVWQSLKLCADAAEADDAMRQHCLMSRAQFQALVAALEHLRDPLAQEATALRFENKLLLVLRWLVHYEEYRVLAARFGTSNAIISDLLRCALPLLAGHFARHIPNRIDAQGDVVAVIGAMHHARRRHVADALFAHGMTTHMLVDARGLIASFVTSVTPRLAVHEAAPRLESFSALLGERYALGHASYGDTPYVVTDEHADDVEAREFALHRVDDFVSRCAVLARENRYKHSRASHIACVFVVCGWYNWLNPNTALTD